MYILMMSMVLHKDNLFKSYRPATPGTVSNAYF